jgi:anti-sigma factor RsiW
MSERRISFETLNAYVDGELDPGAAAEVARAVAEDAALARELSALSRLRSAVAESIQVPSLSVPAPRRRSGGMAVAASIALMAFIAGSILVAKLYEAPDTDWLARAWQVHRGWSVTEATARDGAKLHFTGYAEAMPEAYVPDLSASRLTLVHADSVPFTGKRRALLAGYRGTRGCRISLLIFSARSGLGDVLSSFRDGRDEGYGWRAGALGYVILSDGMDSNRFRLLAESVRNASREHLPFDNRTRMALRRSRDESAACVT